MHPSKVPALVFAALLLPSVFLASSCSKKPETAPQPVQPPPLAQLLTPQAPPAADASTPKAASLAFANALVAGDIPAMSNVVQGTDTRLFAYYAGLAEVVASSRIFVTALKSQFGDETLIPPQIEHLGNLPPMPSNYEELTEQIDGDRAVLVDTRGHPGVRLVKVDGAWKVDLITTESLLTPDAAAALTQARGQFATMKKGFDQATAKILDGTYTDSKAALEGAKAALSQP